MLQQLSESTGPPFADEESVWSVVQKSLLAAPDRLAIASLHQPSSLYDIPNSPRPGRGGLRWTNSSLQLAVDRFSEVLRKNGIQKGHAIGTLLTNGVESYIVFLSALRVGAVYIPINLKCFPEEINHILDLTKPSMLIVQDEALVQKVTPSVERSDSLHMKVVIDAGPSTKSSWLSFGDLMDPEYTRTMPTIKDRKPQFGNDIILVLFTSGTTGLPKGVPYTNTAINAVYCNHRLDASRQDKVYCASLPVYFTLGCVAPLVHIMAGSAIVFPSANFNTDATLDALENDAVTHISLVPSLIYALKENIQSRSSPMNISSLEDIFIAGSPVTEECIHDSLQVLRSTHVSLLFGMTEGWTTWTGPQRSVADLMIDGVISCGHIGVGAQVKVCEWDSHEPLPRGSPGEIHQAGPSVTKRYLNDVSPESFYVDESGTNWIRTGDQGIMHNDGRICVTGKYKDLINRGGEKFAPLLTEQMITQLTKVQVSFTHQEKLGILASLRN